MNPRIVLSLVLAAATVLLTACGGSAPRDRTVTVLSESPDLASQKPGPPPHAPAHGYRHRHQGQDMVYNSNLGLYVVKGEKETYYWEGNYYRPSGTSWLTAKKLKGKWTTARKSKLPEGLRSTRSTVVN